MSTVSTLVWDTIISYLDHCNSLLIELLAFYTCPPQTILNKLARMILIQMESLLNILKWLPIHLTIKDKVLKMPSKLCEIWFLVTWSQLSYSLVTPVLSSHTGFQNKRVITLYFLRVLSNLTFSMRSIQILSCKTATTTAWVSSPHILPPLLCSIFPYF